MIICSQCGNDIADGLSFCSVCGNAVATFSAMPITVPHSPNVNPFSAVQPAPGSQPPVQAGNYVQPPRLAPSAVVRTNSLAWILIPVGLLVVVLMVVIGIKSSRSNATVSAATPQGRLATCKFNGVHVRDAPKLEAFTITDINKYQAVRVMQESTNRDSVFIQSINQTVYDNWSEIQVEGSSVRGWVFSGFIR
jgi:hypothetical protein